jgi:hypothetical protein
MKPPQSNASEYMDKDMNQLVVVNDYKANPSLLFDESILSLSSQTSKAE